MAPNWHYQLFGEEFGPVTEEMLRELLTNGTLGEDDSVRTTGGKWQRASQALASNASAPASTATALASDVDLNAVDPDTAAEWYCQVLGQELGPLSFDELLHFAESGELSADDQIRFGATGKWRRVGSMGRLVAVMPYQNSSVTRVGKKPATKPAAAPAETSAPSPVAKAATPQVTYAPAASEPVWFAWIRGVEYGPSSLLQLQQYITTGQLGPADFVKYGMTGAWCPPATVSQMLAQYVITVPAAPAATVAAPAPVAAAAPVVKKPSAVSVPTVTAPKPAPKPSNAEVTPPAPKPAVAEAPAKVEPPPEKPAPPPVAEPVSKPAPMAASSSSTNSYGGSGSQWQAKTVTAPPKPAARPAKSSGGGMSFDFSAITSMLDAKTLGIGGGVIAAAALVFGLMYLPAGQGAEVQAFKELHPLYVEFQKIREKKGSQSEVEALSAKVAKVCPPIAKTMEPRASVSRPASQKLFWVAKYRMNEMITKGVTARSPAEVECERMLYEVSQVLKLPMDAPKPMDAEPAAKGKENPGVNFGT